ncbi:N-acetylmuramoyl-L-alanine amidase [Histidinibacterium aquaticum]|uniref:N-acetylmuramoyl-L-alanine amidase n=1 Tax=Histidinibacterium aquaticum TaxID=2613962 RepID=A0A5J5GP37_9RHOB|nr:N-acetylmuramoyl-L-alanine amidase [Histidinibacterium aquaticum]KAA9010146.1 N-acetylmuramoyl-L-alanine amidase [Histidinibacterium aquaticum]
MMADGALWHPSPNFGDRRGGVRPDMVVLHYTAMESCDAALERLCAPEHGVSSHYLIGEDGSLLQLVAEEQRAWHAGQGAWGPVTDVNSRSIGIELDNRGDHPFAEVQVAALESLLSDILERHAIPPERVIGHSDMAPSRKRDPGPHFPWQRLAEQGLSVWPETGAAPELVEATPERLARLTAALTGFGYRGSQATLLFDAFRQRFRPEAGAFDGTDLAMAEDLALRWPVRPD